MKYPKKSESLKRAYQEGRRKAWAKGLTKETSEKLRLSTEKSSKKRIELGVHKGQKYKLGWRKIKITKEELVNLYWTQRLSQRKIGKKFNTSGTYIQGYFKLYNIPIRTESERNANCHKGVVVSQETRDKIRNTLKGQKHTEERKTKIGLKSKERWENKEFREKNIKNMLSGLLKRPTTLERDFITVVEKHNLPYKYVGDGSFLIGYKNPDFVNVNGEKVAIEVYYTWFKLNHNKQTEEQYRERRSKYFSAFGWKTFFFNETELKNEQLILEVLK